MSKIIAMIPARIGSQRLTKKNLRPLDGLPLIVHAIRKCKEIDLFDEVWVNSDSDEIEEIASKEGVLFHKRPAELASHTATSEDYIYEFLKARECEYVCQVHSIAPLLTKGDIVSFVEELQKCATDTQLSVVEEQIECAVNSVPVNFSFDRKTNSQELSPVQRITWSITAWKRASYLKNYDRQYCATYSGKVSFFPIPRMAGHIIKTQEDLEIAEIFLKQFNKKRQQC